MDGECPECGADMGGGPDGFGHACPGRGYGETGHARSGGRAPGARAAGYAPLNIGIKGAVCRRGHVMEEVVFESDEYDEPCPECGSDVITGCPKCGLEIDAGESHVEVTPACLRCGEPFPWSARARRARRLDPLKILGAIAAGVTIIAGLLYVGTFLG